MQPLLGEIADERPGTGVRQHAPDLLFKYGRLFQFALLREGQQLIVRDAAPEKERKT